MKGKIELTPGAVLLLTAVAALSGVKMAALMVAAAAFHELGHWAAIRLCGGRVTRVLLGAGGARMWTAGSFGYLTDAAVALAGPGASALLAMICGTLGDGAGREWMYTLAGLSALYCLFNLLPMGPMDGGRALYAVCSALLGPGVADNVRFFVDLFCSALLAAGGAYIFLESRGNVTALVCAGFMIKACCKTARFGVKSYTRRFSD